MPVRQGGKYYAQVLLDLNRYKLLEELAQSEGKKVTALIREFTYQALEQQVPASDYKAAEAADTALWAESVRRRVQGRQKNRKPPTAQQRLAKAKAVLEKYKYLL
jgi:hypothetical protein